jgi:hypothetical protein
VTNGSLAEVTQIAYGNFQKAGFAQDEAFELAIEFMKTLVRNGADG